MLAISNNNMSIQKTYILTLVIATLLLTGFGFSKKPQEEVIVEQLKAEFSPYDKIVKISWGTPIESMSSWGIKIPPKQEIYPVRITLNVAPDQYNFEIQLLIDENIRSKSKNIKTSSVSSDANISNDLFATDLKDLANPEPNILKESIKKFMSRHPNWENKKDFIYLFYTNSFGDWHYVKAPKIPPFI